MIRAPLITLIVAFALALAALLVLRRIHVDTSLTSLFDDDDPAAVAMRDVMERFAAVEELLLLVQSPADRPPQADVLIAFAQRLEHSIASDTTAAALSAGVSFRADPQVRQFIEKEIVPNAIFYLRDDAFAAAQQRLTREGIRQQIRRAEALIATPGPAAGAMAKVLLQDPLRLHEFLLEQISSGLPTIGRQGNEAFLARDGRALLIRVRGRRPVSDLEFSKKLTGVIRSIAERANRDELTVDYSGGYAIATRSEQAIRRDMISTVISSVILLQLLFVATFRRPLRSFLLAFLPVGVGVLYGFGVYALLGRTLTPMTAVIGGVLAGMAIDYAIEFLTFYHARRRAATSGVAASEARRHVSGAIVAAWATSIACFLVITLSDAKALRDFALVAMLGLSGAFVCAIVLLPALLVVTDRSASERGSLLRLPIEPLVELAVRWRGRLIAITLAGFAVAGATLLLPGPILPLESDLSVMHPRPNAPLDALQAISQRMGASPGGLLVHLRADDDAALVRLAHAVRNQLARAEVRAAGISGTLGLASVLPDPAVTEPRIAASGEAMAQRVIADFRAAIGDSIFDPAAYQKYEQFLRTLLTAKQPPTVDDLRRYPKLAEMILPATNDPRSEAITLVFSTDASGRRAARDEMIHAVRDALDQLKSATLTGLSVLNHDTELAVRRDLPRLVAMALAAVTVYLAIHFRNLRDCALAILPTILSLVCVLAFMRLAGQKLNMINLVAFPLLIGLDIDYGIFVVSAARKRVAAQVAPAAAAVTLCAATTFLGFGSLVFTSVPAVRSLGAAVAVGVATCAAATLLLVMPLALARCKEDAT